MTMVTRNVADFKPTGVTIINPWEAHHNQKTNFQVEKPAV
jgi:hypothetical protein